MCGGCTLILLIALFLAILFVTTSYWVAGDVWVRRHSLKYRIGTSERQCSGAIGEIFLVSFGALLLYFVDRASNAISIFDVLREYPWQSFMGLVLVGSIAYFHGMRTAMKAPDDEKPVLIKTYLVYGAFSSIFFFGGLLMVGILIAQSHTDYQTFNAVAPDILGRIGEQTLTDPDLISKQLEISFLDAQTLLASVEESMAPVFVFVAGIFAVNLAIRLTPLRSLFVSDAIVWTHGSTFVALIFILLAGGMIYVGYYSVFIDDYLQSLANIKETIIRSDAEAIQRYSEIVLTITDQKSLVGFISRMSSEWGGLAALLGLAQWISEQFSKPEAPQSPADDLIEI